MKVTFPVAITPANLLASNVSEEDLPAWQAGVTYAVAQRVISERRIWEAVKAGKGQPPSDNPEYWVDLGATNRWAMFDQKVGSQSRRATPIVVEFAPGIVSDVAVLNVDAESALLELRDGGEVVWRSERDLRTGEVIVNWFDYFFSEFRNRTDVIFTGVPPYAQGVLTLTVAKPVNDVAVGEVLVGRSMTFGQTQISPRLGITDYSRKEADAWGDYFVVERAFSRRMSVSVLVDNRLVDEVYRLLNKHRATPLIWSADDERFSSLIVYGFYRSFDIVVAHHTHSFCSLDIEGLT
ncbi:hypothetical protein QTH87_05995 [Variovorax sp. J22P168]|uniref:hypothetical protein n=1 Tax=Variovorax jilinensis TaxID=3053513 RepID=UPI0025755D98|nr:hypothetical protein [Variovorax sp. J22P168]MDM0011990.1 hypothetical protein [Variovorax sp. J22P168]